MKRAASPAISTPALDSLAKPREGDSVRGRAQLRVAAEGELGMTEPDRRTPAEQARDKAHWIAVEEVVELMHEERFHECLVELRLRAQGDSSNPYVFYFMAVALFEVGELAPCRDAYLACLRLAPEHLGARIALSHVERQLGNAPAAVREALIALKQAPEDGDALYAAGLGYAARGDKVMARRYLEAFLKAKPEFETAVDVKTMLESFDEFDFANN
jgi:tetratricopeptide (TPR) repeat protein